MIYKIAKALNVPIDTFASDFEEDNVNIFLSNIKADVDGMSKKQYSCRVWKTNIKRFIKNIN